MHYTTALVHFFPSPLFDVNEFSPLIQTVARRPKNLSALSVPVLAAAAAHAAHVAYVLRTLHATLDTYKRVKLVSH